VVYLASWDAIPDRLSFSAAFEGDKAIDARGRAFVQFGHALTAHWTWTPRLKTFAEWVSLRPLFTDDASVGSQHYFHPGVTFLLHRRLQLDAHGFLGLNGNAVAFSGGPGLSVRF
jgi:hypothetical protein